VTCSQPQSRRKDRLIVALDLPGVAEAEAMIARLGDSVSFYKIGYQLAYAGGLPLAQQLAKSGKKVFVDLKLHDIGNTVARGVESVAKLGATFLTVHAYPQTMKAAVEGRAGSRPEDPRGHCADLVRRRRSAMPPGYRLNVSDLVEARAQQAQVLGVDGLVSSPAGRRPGLRKIVGPPDETW
jgi:orotidine-5'-phosphate decarboxylase